MEGFGGLGVNDVNSSVRKKRSNTSRRPPLDLSQVSSDDNNRHCPTNREKEINVQFSSRASFSNNDEYGAFADSDGASRRCGEETKLGSVQDDFDNSNNKVKKVKLKVGSVSKKASRISDSPRHKVELKEDWNEGPGLQESQQMDSRTVANIGTLNSLELDENTNAYEIEKHESVRKSRRVPKRRFVYEVLDDEDEEYLEKIKTSKSIEYKERESRRQRKTLKKNHDMHTGDYGQSRSRREAKVRSGRVFDDTDYLEKDEPISDDEPRRKKKKSKYEFVESVVDHKNERTVTTRQRALQNGKYAASSLGSPLIEFPDGLPPAPPRKQKDKPSELEQQLKKSEAAQRRKIQAEKAARESEAEAIRKILGQDSSRKKREEKIKKQREDHALERAANAMIFGSDTVRWVMGPSGTTVIFPTEMGLPNIFDTKPCSYPPPREKCAGPSCTNPYKYRDSRSKLPLCSLQCYKAVHEKSRRLICVLN